MAGLAIITEACVDTKDRACVDVCPVQCIYEFDPATNQLFSEAEAGSGEIANTHAPAPDAIGIFGDSVLYVNLDECTSCTACYQPDVCPVGAIYADEHVPDGTPNAKYNKADTAKGHDHTFFVQLSQRRLRRLRPPPVGTASRRPVGSSAGTTSPSPWHRTTDSPTASPATSRTGAPARPIPAWAGWSAATRSRQRRPVTVVGS